MANGYSDYIKKLSATAKTILFEKEFEDDLCAVYRRDDGRRIEFRGERYVSDLFGIFLTYPNCDQEFLLDLLMKIFDSRFPTLVTKRTGDHFDCELKFLLENIDGWLGGPENFLEKYASVADAIPESVEELERLIGELD